MSSQSSSDYPVKYQNDSFSTSSNEKILVTGGQNFSIKLKSNPTTGYNWTLVNRNDLGVTLLTPANLSEYGTALKHEIDNPQLMGSPGYSYFNFNSHPNNTNSKQNVVLEFQYKRSWETQIIATLLLDVEIQ